MKKLFLLFLIFSILIGGFDFSMPEAQAMDPVTIAILAPLAIKAAQFAAPYVKRGLLSGALRMLEIGKDVLGILLLPIGVLGVTVGAPLGFFSSGLQCLGQGFMSIIYLVGDTLILPISFFGIGAS